MSDPKSPLGDEFDNVVCPDEAVVALMLQQQQEKPVVLIEQKQAQQVQQSAEPPPEVDPEEAFADDSTAALVRPYHGFLRRANVLSD